LLQPYPGHYPQFTDFPFCAIVPLWHLGRFLPAFQVPGPLAGWAHFCLDDQTGRARISEGLNSNKPAGCYATSYNGTLIH